MSKKEYIPQMNMSKEEYKAKIQIGKIGNLTEEEIKIIIDAVKQDEYLWGEILQHYDDAEWPEDFDGRLGGIAKRHFDNVDWSDLAMILASLRSQAAQQKQNM